MSPGPICQLTNSAPTRARIDEMRVVVADTIHLVLSVMSCNHQRMPVWTRVLNWVRIHPWRAALAGLGIWVSGAASLDVLETLHLWHPGGQATELLGGLLGLPLTGVAVVVLFDHLERARWRPYLIDAGGVPGDISRHFRSRSPVCLTGGSSPLPIARACLSPEIPLFFQESGSETPAMHTIELLRSALLELEPGADNYDLMRSIEWDKKQVSFPGTRSAHLADQAQTIIDITKDMLLWRDDAAGSVGNLYEILDDVRSLSTDPQEIEAIDALMEAVRFWVSCHPTSKAHHERTKTIYEDALRMKRSLDSAGIHDIEKTVTVKVTGELSTWSDFETEVGAAHHLLGLLAKLWPEPTTQSMK